MEGIPQETLDQHRNRIIQNFYQAQEDRRVATGNPLPGQSNHAERKKIKIETRDELLHRFREWRALKKRIANGEEVALPTPKQQQQQPSAHQMAPQGYSDGGLPARLGSGGVPGATGLPQRPTSQRQQQQGGDDIDQMIRMAEAGVKPALKGDAAGEEAGAKKKEKKGRMVYDDAEISPEERMAMLPRYAFTPTAA